MIKKSAVAVAIALGAFAVSANAAVELSGSAKLGMDRNMTADSTDRIAEVKLNFGITQEITEELTFDASASAGVDGLLDDNVDTDDNLDFDGVLNLTHTTFGKLSVGDGKGSVLGNAAFATKLDGWKPGAGDEVIGYEYNNSFGPLSVAAGFWDRQHDLNGDDELVDKTDGFSMSATYAILDGLKAGVSFASFDAAAANKLKDADGNLIKDGDKEQFDPTMDKYGEKVSKTSVIAGVEYADLYPGLTLAANVGFVENGGSDTTYAAQAAYTVIDGLNTYAATQIQDDTDFKFGGDYTFDIIPGFTNKTEASYEVKGESGADNVYFLKNAVTFWSGAEVYVAREEDEGEYENKFGASYSISF